MIGTFFIVGATALFGLLLGRFYRVPALAVGSAVAAAALMAAGEVSGWSAYGRAMLLLSGLTTLQGSYVVGVWTRSVARCRRSSRAEPESLHESELRARDE